MWIGNQKSPSLVHHWSPTPSSTDQSTIRSCHADNAQPTADGCENRNDAVLLLELRVDRCHAAETGQCGTVRAFPFVYSTLDSVRSFSEIDLPSEIDSRIIRLGFQSGTQGHQSHREQSLWDELHRYSRSLSTLPDRSCAWLTPGERQIYSHGGAERCC